MLIFTTRNKIRATYIRQIYTQEAAETIHRKQQPKLYFV